MANKKNIKYTYEMQQIKTGFLVAYDYYLLKHALPLVYKSSDIIVLAIDINRKTWAGNPFHIEPEFFEWIKAFDVDDKIKIYEDEFYVANLPLKEMETRQRNKLAQYLGLDGWHIQLDCDEYFMNFDEFVRKLQSIIQVDSSIFVKWKTILKQDDKGYYFISGFQERIPVATNNPVYRFTRITNNKNKINLNFTLLHQSWGRGESDVLMKLQNWGHARDYDVMSFFELWKSINRYNYKYIKDFQPLNPKAWPGIEYVETFDFNQIKDILIKDDDRIQSHRLKKIIRLLLPPIFYKISKYFRKSFFRLV